MEGALHHLSQTLKYWGKLTLVNQFAIAGSVFTVAAMFFCGVLITTITADNVVQQRGAAIALFMDGVIAPFLRDLTEDGTVSSQQWRRLDSLMNMPSFRARFPYLEVWLPDGTIVYSNSRSIVGRRFPLPDAAGRAFDGEAVTTFTDLGAQEHVVRGLQSDLLEVYAPVRATANGPIVAVAEIHEDTAALRETLMRVTLTCWGAVGATGLIMMAGFFGIVRRGSHLIEWQRRALAKRLQRSHSLNRQYRELKEQAERASRDVSELTDKYLRTIGADLHDGPAQMIGFAALKVEQARQAGTDAGRERTLASIETALSEALEDIRNISRGLVLPDIEWLPLDEIIDHAVDLHRQRTGIAVDLDNRAEPLRCAAAVSTCVFRFVQEGLNNAYRHGLADDQQVTASTEGGVLRLAVINRNPASQAERAKASGIGLYGLRARAQAIGGTIDFLQEDGHTRLEMSLDLSERPFHE